MHARVIFWGWGTTWNSISDVYMFAKGKKSFNADKDENVELTHTQVCCANNCTQK